MLYSEISEIHTKHTNTLCGQNVELLDVKLVEYKVTLRLWKLNIFQGSGYCVLQAVLTHKRMSFSGLQCFFELVN